MSGSGEDGVDAVAVLAFEKVAVEQAVVLHMADDGFDGAAATQLAADGFGGGLVAGAPDLEAVEAVGLKRGQRQSKVHHKPIRKFYAELEERVAAAETERLAAREIRLQAEQDAIRFLNAIEAAIPAGKVIHVILDNYATHKAPKVREWLVRHPRFVFHFTPTSASWLNAVEGYFAKLTNRRLKRGVFHSIVDLQAAINRFLEDTNDHPKPFTWTADPERIIAAVKRGHQALDSIH